MQPWHEVQLSKQTLRSYRTWREKLLNTINNTVRSWQKLQLVLWGMAGLHRWLRRRHVRNGQDSQIIVSNNETLWGRSTHVTLLVIMRWGLDDQASVLLNSDKDAAKWRPQDKTPNYMYALYLGADNNGERKDQSGWEWSTTTKNEEEGRRRFCMWANGWSVHLYDWFSLHFL